MYDLDVDWDMQSQVKDCSFINVLFDGYAYGFSMGDIDLSPLLCEM